MKKPKKTEDPSPVLFGSAAPAAAPQPKRAKSALAFSYSKLSLYEECPLKYKFKYIDKIKEDMAKAAAEAALAAQTGKPEASAAPAKESEPEGTITETASSEKE